MKIYNTLFKKASIFFYITVFVLFLFAIVAVCMFAIHNHSIAYAMNIASNNKGEEAFDENLKTERGSFSQQNNEIEFKTSNINSILLSNNSNEQNEINLNQTGLENFTNIKWSLYNQYFYINPLHANNTTDLNPKGVCTTVAMQMLMGYYNYYFDRRLIPRIGENNVEYLSSDYGNVLMDPELNYYSSSISDIRCNIGTQDGFFYELFNLTTWPEFPGLGQNIPAIKNAANRFVEKYASVIKDQVSITAGIYTYQDAVNEINAGRPIILGYQPLFTPADSFHVVVAYGYATYNGTNGFIVHKGYGANETQVWIPESWFGYKIKMSVNHEHNFDYYTTNLDGSPFDKFECKECGYSFVNYLFEVDKDTNTLVKAIVPLSRVMIIPYNLYGTEIKIIGESAFRNHEEIESLYLPIGLEEIGKEAFVGCTSMKTIFLPSSLTRIKDYAFSASGLTSVSIPSSVVEIGNSAFMFTLLEEISFSEESNLEIIGANAFTLNVHLEMLIIPNSVKNIGKAAIGMCSELKYIWLPSNLEYIDEIAFTMCNNLTIYTSRNNSAGWNQNWNDSNIPVVWGCDFSNGIIKSFVKSENNPSNIDQEMQLNNPQSDEYSFEGWYVNPNFSGEKYTDIKSAPNGTLYAKWNKNSCIVEGTLITLADGSLIPVEELTGDEMLLVWNLFTGSFDVAPILFVDSEEAKDYEVIILTFSDGTTLKIVDEHALWNFDLNRYVYLREDAEKYVGNWFYKQYTDENGCLNYKRVKLVDVHIEIEFTRTYSPVTYKHLCFYANGMLSMPGATEGLTNIFYVNGQDMKFDEDMYNEDVSQYGLFTYEEFSCMFDVPEVVFDAFNGKYLKISISKGLISFNEIMNLIERYNIFFRE